MVYETVVKYNASILFLLCCICKFSILINIIFFPAKSIFSKRNLIIGRENRARPHFPSLIKRIEGQRGRPHNNLNTFIAYTTWGVAFSQP